MLGRSDSRGRLVTLLVAMAVFAGLLGVRLAYWQVGEAADLRRQAEAQLFRPSDSEIRRGDIYDRRGTLLATTAYRDLLAAHPDLMPADRRADIADRLADLLDFDLDQRQQLIDRFASDVPYVIVARRLTETQSQQVRQGLAGGELAALSLEPRAVRFYPNAGGTPATTLASQLLGFVSADGKGQYGIEQRHHELLAGQLGVTAAAEGALLPAAAGGDLQLTIDASLQLRLEKELYAAWVANRAERVSAVVMDPHSGAILAWGSVPGYDANDYSTTAQRKPELFIDPIATKVYEPGSVMKMYTAAAALEGGIVTPHTVIRDESAMRFGETIVIRNFDRRAMGPITFEDVIARSRNVATGKVALRLGPSTDKAAGVLYEMWRRLGLGTSTGIELAGEAAGLVSDPAVRRWTEVDIVNRAFGQGLAVTQLQLAVGFAAMVNGGLLVQPHLLEAAGGVPTTQAEPLAVLDPALSEQLREMMVHVVTSVPHYADTTLVPGYVVGGKTGTAQIWDTAKGAWKDPIYNHSFVGFVGSERPAAVIAVRVHEAEPRVKKRFGYILDLTANEIFRRIAQDVVEMLDLPPLAHADEDQAADDEASPAGEP
jgi:cell division protein FtsI (penicillin-binding protein 3)